METINSGLKGKKALKEAKMKAKKLREFYAHLRTYLIVNSLFFLINWMTSPGDWWVLYPVIGWGFCLTIHTIDALSPFRDFDDRWEERKTRELIEKYNHS
jgi:hypothetical protein